MNILKHCPEKFFLACITRKGVEGGKEKLGGVQKEKREAKKQKR